MDEENYREYLANRDWSDMTIPQGIDLLAAFFNIDLNSGICSIEETNFFEDTKLSADLKMIVNDYPYMIGYRSRKIKYVYDYPFDVTIRFRNKAGYKTEFAKIMEGCGDFNLYTFTDNDKIVRWILMDLHAFRKAHIYNGTIWQPKDYIKTQLQSNARANDTDFMAYDMLTIKRGEEMLEPIDKIIKAHSAGYFEDIITTKLPSKTNRKIEYHKVKKQGERIDGY